MNGSTEMKIEDFWEENPCGDSQIFGFQSEKEIEDQKCAFKEKIYEQQEQLNTIK